MTGIKFCGMTRAEDAVAAVDAGAAYVGVVFAASKRQVDETRAREILQPVRGRVAAVGVFGASAPTEIAYVARAAALDVVQLHGDPTPADVVAVRSAFGGSVWAAYRAREGQLGDAALALADIADALVLDAFHPGALGGTGVTLPWDVLAPRLVPLRGRRASIVLAGGLDPANVGTAIARVGPDIVDVASGVERAPGIKDHQKLRAFAAAVETAARTVGRDE